MEEGPHQPGGLGPRQLRAIGAAWCVAVGLVLGAACVICLALGAISPRQAVGIALPAVLLIAGGLIVAAIPDPATGRRTGFLAGFRAGLLFGRWRSVFRRNRNKQ
jgi:hypothetical protein